MKGALEFVFSFEDAVVRHAKSRGMDGVVCGHIHVPAMHEREGIVYLNCGDWVDSYSAIVEHIDGRKELVRWSSGPAAVNSTVGGHSTSAAIHRPSRLPT